MKRVEAKTFLMLTLPVLAVIVFAGAWSWRQRRLDAIKAQNDVKNVRVVECVVVHEPAATTTIQKWRDEEGETQRRLLQGGTVSGLKQLSGWPTPKIAPQNGILFRAKFYSPCGYTNLRAQATDLKTGQMFFGVGVHRRFEGNQSVHEEIFDLSAMRKCKQVKFSAELSAFDGTKSRTVTVSKVIAPSNF